MCRERWQNALAFWVKDEKEDTLLLMPVDINEQARYGEGSGLSSKNRFIVTFLCQISLNIALKVYAINLLNPN